MPSATNHYVTKQDYRSPLSTRRGFHLILPLMLIMLFMVLPGAESQAAGKAFISDKAPKEGYQKIGDEFYAKRADGFKNGLVDSSIISNALGAYQKAYALGNDSEELAVKLLRATYFYTTYAEKTPAKQKKALTNAMEIGEEVLKQYPSSVALNYQMAGAWGTWGELNGIFSSARKGVADKAKHRVYLLSFHGPVKRNHRNIWKKQ